MEEKQIKLNDKKGLITIIFVAVALILGLYFAYTKLLNPKAVFIKAVNTGYKKVERLFDDEVLNKTEKNKPFVMTNDINFSMDVDQNFSDPSSRAMLEEFKKLKISEKIGYDRKNSEMMFVFNYLYGNESIMNIGSYFKDNKTYIEIKNALDKYIEMPSEGTTTTKKSNLNISNDELKYLLSKTKDAFINNMESKDFKQSTEKIKKDKKTIKVSKITYGISEKGSKKLNKKALETLSKDSKYIKIVSKLTGQKEAEVKKSMEQSIKDLEKELKNDKLDTKTTTRIGVLLRGISRKYAGLIIESDEAKFVYYEKGKEKEVRLSNKNIDVISASKKGDKTTITIKSASQEMIININKKEKGKKVIYEYDLTISGVRLSGKLEIEKLKENKDGSGETKITFDMSMMGLVTFKVTDNMKYDFVDKIKFPDLSNSIKYTELSPEDIQNIREKMINLEAIKSLSNVFGEEEQLNVY